MGGSSSLSNGDDIVWIKITGEIKCDAEKQKSAKRA
jgi:hypothetical protein